MLEAVPCMPLAVRERFCKCIIRGEDHRKREKRISVSKLNFIGYIDKKRIKNPRLCIRLKYRHMGNYNKPPLTYTEQVELLRSRGMVISDEQRTERHLANISYYCLSAYMLPYKQKKNGKILDSFREGITWDMVYNRYVFDRKLRLLIFDAIERLEVAIRAQIIYQLSHKYDSHWQDRPEIFNPPKNITLRGGKVVATDVYGDIQKHIKEQLHNNKAEVFIQHYCNKYDTPENPPSWMSVEVMYFNTFRASVRD